MRKLKRQTQCIKTNVGPVIVSKPEKKNNK